MEPQQSCQGQSKLFDQIGNQPNDPAFYAARAALMKENIESALKDPSAGRHAGATGMALPQLLAEHFIVSKTI
jgi:hypothetical protein